MWLYQTVKLEFIYTTNSQKVERVTVKQHADEMQSIQSNCIIHPIMQTRVMNDVLQTFSEIICINDETLRSWNMTV